MKKFYIPIRYVFSLPFFLFFSSSSLAQAKGHKIMHFHSVVGSFTMETPLGWSEITIDSTESFDGRIVIGNKDTLVFSYGFWDSRLRYGLLPSTYDEYHVVTATKYPIKIDGCTAYTEADAQIRDWTARIYIDSVFYIGRRVMHFDLYGHYLSPDRERRFYAAARTLAFEKRSNQ